MASACVSLNAAAALSSPAHATGSDGLAEQVQNREPDEQPDHLVWPLHHLHRRLSVSGSPGDDEVTVPAAQPLSPLPALHSRLQIIFGIILYKYIYIIIN